MRDLCCAQYIVLLHGKDVVDDIQECLKCSPDHHSTVDGCVTVEDLLEHFRVGDQSLVPCCQAFQQDLCLRLKPMFAPNQVHRNVRVDKDQDR